MTNQSDHVALAALEYWASVALGHPDAQAIPELLREHVRQSAWQVAGLAASAGSDFPQPQEEVLQSIFTRIRPRDGSAIPESFVRRSSLRLEEETLFPTPNRLQALAGEHPANALRQAIAELKRDLPGEARLEGTLFALQQHAWSLPSPLQAVSLYDFAHLHAAFVAATANNPTGEVSLVGGDLSGVQDFIYRVTAKGATKQLRGRSLYLQLLTDACAQFVLSNAGMPLSNLLYAGGGRFYALLPGNAQEQLRSWRRQIGSRLLNAHQGALYLALGCVSFAPTGYNDQMWRNLNEVINADKRRRFADLTPDEFAKLFIPHQPEPPAVAEANDEPEPLDLIDASLERLGSQLNRARILAEEVVEARQIHTTQHWYDVLTNLGLRLRLDGDEPDRQVPPDRYRRLLYLDDSDRIALKRGDIRGTRYTVLEAKRLSADDVRRYTTTDLSTDTELRPDDVMPFNILADQSQGITRLGVLRMDVDNLGDIFGQRFDRANGMAALACTSALSSALSRFFEGWVGELCRQANSDGQNGGVYAVYSGGDDLFLVGSWHRMPMLALQIRQDFIRYILGRALASTEQAPMSLSAGITLHGGSYPLYQAAEDAADALDTAKAFERAEGYPKDAIAFLGRALGWEQFVEAEQLCHELVALIDSGAPRALLMTIQRLDAHAQQGRRARDGAAQFAYGPWIWHGAYLLTRMAEGKPPEIKAQIETLRERIVGAQGVSTRFIERAGLAARWAQLLIRNHDTEER